MTPCLWRDLTPSGRAAFISELKTREGICAVEPYSLTALAPPVFISLDDERVYPMGCGPSRPPLPTLRPLIPPRLPSPAASEPLLVDVTRFNSVITPFPWLPALILGGLALLALRG